MSKIIIGFLFAVWVQCSAAIFGFNFDNSPISTTLLVAPPILIFVVLIDKIWEICELLKALLTNRS